jgi:hypothetical protein
MGDRRRKTMTDPKPLRIWDGLGALGRCVVGTARLIATGRLHEPRINVGRHVRWADGTSSTVYRETVADVIPTDTPTTLVVSFRLRGVRSDRLHRLFRLESELNTILFAGFPGFVSKLWFADDERGVYRGLYDWHDPASAEAYVRALWWALIVVSERPSIHYIVLPGIRRDDLLELHVADDVVPDGLTAWWRPDAFQAPS